MNFCARAFGKLTLLTIVCSISGSILGGHSLAPRSRPSPTGTKGAQPGAGTGLLTAGQTITRNFAGNETHSYSINLRAGEFLNATIEQKGIDLRVVIFDPAGRKLRELDGRQRTPTPISAVGSEPGEYRLQIDSADREQSPGAYELKISDIRPASARDKDRVREELATAEGDLLFKQGLLESNRAAATKYEAAASLARAIGDGREEGYALKRIGDIHQSFSEFPKALAAYKSARAAYARAQDRRGESAVHNEITRVHLSLGENNKALGHCVEARRLSKSAGDRASEADALNNLGEIHNWSGDLQLALNYYRQAQSVFDELHDRRGQAQSQLYLGYTYSDLGQPHEAFLFFNRALAVWQSTNEYRSQAITLSAIGRLYSRIGESQVALNTFARALPMARSVGDPIEEGRILNGMAYTYDQLGELKKALEHYHWVISIYRTAGYAKGAGATLYDAGRIYNSLGQSREALKCFQEALAISRAVEDHRLEAFEIREIGHAYDSMGQKQTALEHYLRALSFWRAGKDFRPEAETLNWLGQIYASRGEREKADTSFKRALMLSRKAEYRFAEAASLHNMARFERDGGNLVTARARAEEALAVAESLRGKINSQDLRTTYFASIRQQYEFYVDLLMRLHAQNPAAGFDYSAFEASERSRARSLLETLALTRVSLRDHTDPALLDRQNQLSKELNGKAQRQMELKTGGQAAAYELGSLEKEIDELTWQLHEVDTQIRSRSVEQMVARSTQPLGLRDIQQYIPDDDSLLLEYMLGDEQSYLWVVSRTDVTSYPIPPRSQIEDAVREFRELLTANQPVPGETFEQRESRISAANTNIPRIAQSLGKLLLGPAIDKLGTRRLLIVPDGALQYLPFQALMVESTKSATLSGSSGDPRPLIVDHEIVYQASASALAFVLTDSAQRPQAPKSIAVFANPVFELDDPRVQTRNPDAHQPASNQTAPVYEAFRDVGIGDGRRIPALPASRDEAESIVAVTPWRSSFQALDFAASRATILATDLAQFRVVHFATHGFVDYEHPELSGLVLSLVDEQGNPQEGFLRMHDIYNLKLPVDLVVLSACNTGLGKEVRGEGLIGLTRGFMYAGARGVAASLWKVDDEATSELMRRFYEGMFKKGLTPAAALREAQLGMWQQKRWQAPYYWAAFVIQGRYNQKEILPRGFPFARFAGSSGLLVLAFLLLFLVLRKRRQGLIRVE